MGTLSVNSARIIEIIKAIPKGKVMSYGQVATAAGVPHGARSVVRILHACSAKYDLPWWRVVKASGEIALLKASGAEEQQTRLESEGVIFSSYLKVDIRRCGC